MCSEKHLIQKMGMREERQGERMRKGEMKRGRKGGKSRGRKGERERGKRGRKEGKRREEWREEKEKGRDGEREGERNTHLQHLQWTKNGFYTLLTHLPGFSKQRVYFFKKMF